MVKAKINIAVQLALYKKYRSEIFDGNGNPKPCSDKIYILLQRELEGMSQKAIQTSIGRNKQKIFDENASPVDSQVTLAEGRVSISFNYVGL